jgi:hypothetical protein
MPFSMNAITVSNDQRTIQSHHSYGIRTFRQLPLGTMSFESISCQAYGWTAHEAGQRGRPGMLLQKGAGHDIPTSR